MRMTKLTLFNGHRNVISIMRSLFCGHTNTPCHLHLSPNHGVVKALQVTSQPVSSISLCSLLRSSATWWTPGLSISSCYLPTSFFYLPWFLPSFTVPCNVVLATPDEREKCPHHCNLRLFTMVRRSSCGPIACCILARMSSLVTWSLYEMFSILYKHRQGLNCPCTMDTGT